MVFDSFSFIYICLVPAILLVLGLHKIGGKHKILLENIVLLLFSFLFYYWSGSQYLGVLAVLIFVNYAVGLIGGINRKFRWVLLVGVFFNVGLLVYYKYFEKIYSALVDAKIFQSNSAFENILAPLGISFIIFECISYLMDLYQDHSKAAKNLLEFALYLSFFPKITQGPIVLYRDMEKELRDRKISYGEFVAGLERFIIGMSKKVLLVDILSQTYTDKFCNMAEGMDAGTAWIVVLCYALGLYMDFSGYSDMAIGMAKMFGFHFKENFNFPYLSTSITEFWRRWHISLGTWFKNYLYIPLGGSRKGNVYVNLFIVFLVTGIWHGSGSVYLLWGCLHGVCVVVERFIMKKDWYKKIPKVIKWAVTFTIVSLGWIAFNVSGRTELKMFLGYLVGIGKKSSFSAIYFLTPRLLTTWAVIILGTLIFSREKVQGLYRKLDRESLLFQLVKYVFLLGCLFLCYITLVSEGYSPFLYFQF